MKAVAVGLAVGAIVVAGWYGSRGPARLAAPPSAATWPPYPGYPASCWARDTDSGAPLGSAPSVPVPTRSLLRPPAAIAHSLLTRFGDRRYVRSIRIGRPPPSAYEPGVLGGKHAPADGLWAFISAPEASASGRAGFVASWEAHLLAGALRDDLCEAGGSPLVGWTVERAGDSVSDDVAPFLQRFPNPSPDAYEAAVRAAGRRHGFRLVSLRFLRPRQLAPLVVVVTHRPRAAFIGDVEAIMSELDPHTGAAVTFEGILFEARDARGPFVRVEDVLRGEIEGGQWSAVRNVFPYLHG